MAKLTLAEIKALAAQAAATGENMTEVQAGGGGARLLEPGYSLARLVGYVEYGNQPQEFQGKAQDPALEFRLTFALYSPGYANADGTPYTIKTFNIKRSRNEKAGAYLLFKALNWKSTATHFAELVGEGYLVKIENKAGKAVGAKITSRIDLKGFLPPIDALSKAPYSIPEATDNLVELFLWDYPQLESWNALYIDGTNEDGSSKNWIQNQILSATDFAGSALEALLVSSGTKFTVPVAAHPTPTAGNVPVGALPSAPPQTVAASPVVPMIAAALPNLAAAPAPVVAAPLGSVAPVLPVVPPVVPTAPVLPANVPLVAPALPVA